MDQSRRLFLNLAATTAAMAVLPACRDSEVHGISQNERFPMVTLPDLDGHSISLASFAGAALLINFWATWCEPCRREMPSLQKLSTLFSPQELRIIAISVDDDLNLVREFKLRYGIEFTLLSDHGQKVAKDALNVPGFPMTYLVTRTGVVASVIFGERDWTSAPVLAVIDRALES